MSDTSEDLLNRALVNIRAMDVPECPGSLLPTEAMLPSHIARSDRVGRAAVLVAMSMLLMLIVGSLLRDGGQEADPLNVAHQESGAEGSGPGNPVPSLVAVPGLVHRTAIETVERSTADPRLRFQLGLNDLSVALEDLSRRVQLLRVRNELNELSVAISELIASVD